jgi:hypothetical protein
MANKGIELNKIGKFNDTLSYFDKALALDSTNVPALIEWATHLVARKLLSSYQTMTKPFQ